MRRTPTHSITLLLIGLCAGIMVPSLAVSQEPVACPDATGLFAAYDVVAVKPADPSGPRGLRDLPDGFDGTATVEGLLRTFYPFPSGIANDDLITGLPPWAKDEYFFIQAKMSSEQFASFSNLNRRQRDACQSSMVHSMLRDKFAFRMHPQPRQLPAYELTVAKSGPKLKQATEPGRAVSGDATRHWFIQPGQNGYLTLQADSMSASQLASLLAMAYWGPGRHVIDKTGLAGKYSFTLTFLPEQVTANDFEPAIAKPLEDQLGLRLQKTTVTFDAIIVDHIERPGKD